MKKSENCWLPTNKNVILIDQKEKNRQKFHFERYNFESRLIKRLTRTAGAQPSQQKKVILLKIGIILNSNWICHIRLLFSEKQSP